MPAKSRFVIILYLAAATLISAGAPSSFAQSQSDLTNAQRQAEKIQRDEQNRLQREIEQQRKKAGRPSEVEIPAPPQSTTPSGGPCITVRTIVIDSSPNLDDDDRDRLTAPYVGTCMDKAAIENLMAKITADYIARGFSTTRVFLPAQDLSGGVLRIQVVEGVVEDIIIEDPGNARILAFTAFPGTIGKPFNLRDFEQGLDQINKLATNNAKTDIKPGKTEGGSVIVVRNEPKKWLPVGLTASRDNQGSTSTGRVEDTTALTLDGLAGLNDLWSFSELRTHAYTGGPHNSRAATGMLSLPLGYNTLTTTVSKSSYANEVSGSSDPFMTNGITRTGSLVVGR